MTKVTLTDISSLTNEQAALATMVANNDILETAFDNTLSRDGSLPNAMLSDLDMNSNQILNLPEPVFATDPVRLVDLVELAGGDGAAFIALEERVDDLETGQSAQATAISGLEVSVTENENELIAQAEDITALTSRVTDAEGDIAATSTALSSLSTTVSAQGTTLTAHSSSITSLESDVSGLTTDVNANSTAISALDTRVDAAEGTLTSHSSSITTLNSGLSTANSNISTNASAISSLDTRVTAAEGVNTSQSSSITSLNSTVSGHTTSINNNASAITSLDTRVDATEADIITNSSAITALETTVDDTTAGALFRMTTTTAPDDADAAITMQVRATTADDWSSAGLELIAYDDGVTAESRIRLNADTTQIGQTVGANEDFLPIFEVGTVDGQPSVTINGKLYKDSVINTEMIQEGATISIATLEDDSQNRTYNAWNNSGNGEEFSTLTVALDGDGAVSIECRFTAHGASVLANSDGHFISLEANSVEIYRLTFTNTANFTDSIPHSMKVVVDDLPAGTNTLVAKFRVNDTGVGGSDNATLDNIQWTVIEYHKPAIQAGGAVAATVTYHSTQTDAGAASDPTFSGVSIGTAAANRRIVLGVGYLASTNNVTAITIGGISATKIAQRRPSGTPLVCQLWTATVPTGTTADIVVSTSGAGVNDLAVAVYSVTSAASAYVAASDGGSNTAATPNAISDFEIQSGGAVVVFAYVRGRNTLALSWTGADSVTENVEAAIGSSAARYAGYSFLTTESTTDDDFSFSHANVSSPQYTAYCAASFR